MKGINQMTNMSYCRFENTYKDLDDCINHWFDIGQSDTEKEYKEKLLNLCKMIVNENDNS